AGGRKRTLAHWWYRSPMHQYAGGTRSRPVGVAIWRSGARIRGRGLQTRMVRRWISIRLARWMPAGGRESGSEDPRPWISRLGRIGRIGPIHPRVRERGPARGAGPLSLPGIQVDLIVGHAAAATGHGGSLVLLRQVGDDRLGGQQHGGDRGRVLQAGTGHLQGVDNARLEHVLILAVEGV